MDARWFLKQMAPFSVNTRRTALPVPVSQGRWQALWLQYAVAEAGEKDEELECYVWDAYLLDADGACKEVRVGKEVRVPRAALDAEGRPPFMEYLDWLAGTVGDGATGLAEALDRAGCSGMAPLYEVALSACEEMQ